MSKQPFPSELADTAFEGLTMNDIERVLTAEQTGVTVTHRGETFVSPDSTKISVSNSSARHHDGMSGRHTEISFNISFVISPEDFENDEEENSGPMTATSDDWGLSDSLDDDNTESVDN